MNKNSNPKATHLGKVETASALLVCAGEKRPTRHLFKGREFTQEKLSDDMSISYYELIFSCTCCATDRVWGTEEVAEVA